MVLESFVVACASHAPEPIFWSAEPTYTTSLSLRPLLTTLDMLRQQCVDCIACYRWDPSPFIELIIRQRIAATTAYTPQNARLIDFL
jgi:hypothetical protein